MADAPPNAVKLLFMGTLLLEPDPEFAEMLRTNAAAA
ncbi:hypothetical protein chiPu_0026542, partial [Chiloscyllium punctatum]|nr:hypothetical protein [Chiloscyllium punctatum]